MKINYAAILLFLAGFSCGAAHAQDNGPALDAKLTFDESMRLFNKNAKQQFAVPTVIVFNSSNHCVAKAGNRDIYGENFLSEIDAGAIVCDEISLAEILEATHIEHAAETEPELTFLVLTDAGGICRTCSSIIAEFRSKVLAGIEVEHEIYTIDIGMTDWFAPAAQ